MKKIIAIILALVVILPGTSVLASDIKVQVNGENIAFDRQPVIEDGVVMVPYRFVVEKLGAKVSWHHETKTVFSEYEGDIITIQIGNTMMFVGSTVFNLEKAPYLETDRTLVPVNVIENAFGVKAVWDADNNTVVIEK